MAKTGKLFWRPQALTDRMGSFTKLKAMKRRFFQFRFLILLMAFSVMGLSVSSGFHHHDQTEATHAGDHCFLCQAVSQLQHSKTGDFLRLPIHFTVQISLIQTDLIPTLVFPLLSPAPRGPPLA